MIATQIKVKVKNEITNIHNVLSMLRYVGHMVNDDLSFYA